MHAYINTRRPSTSDKNAIKPAYPKDKPIKLDTSLNEIAELYAEKLGFGPVAIEFRE